MSPRLTTMVHTPRYFLFPYVIQDNFLILYTTNFCGILLLLPIYVSLYHMLVIYYSNMWGRGVLNSYVVTIIYIFSVHVL